MKLLPLGKSFLPLVAFGKSGKNDSPCGNNFIPTRAIGQESYIQIQFLNLYQKFHEIKFFLL